MFADFLTRFLNPDPAPLDSLDAQLALTALLVRVAQSDGHFDAAERATITSITMDRYALTPTEAKDLIDRAVTLEAEAPDTVRFTRAIKESVAYEDRLGVIAAMWRVVLADGARDAEEDALLRLTASLLGVSDRDSNAARLLVTAP